MKTTISSIIVSLILVGFVVVISGCSTESMPTAAEESAESFEMISDVAAKAAQGNRGEWQHMITETFDEGLFANGVLSCLGEDSWWAGTYSWFFKETVTPSGNVNLNLKYELGDDVRLVGMDSGEIWRIYRDNSHFFQHTKRSDGYTYFHQPDDEWFVNDDGQRIKVFSMFDTVYDQDFNVVSDNSRIVACVRIGH